MRVVSGTACPLARDNVDTDQLCPARFMKRRRSEGYGIAFLHGLRFDDTHAPQPNVIDAHPGATILIAGRNFGAGSSREAAVYATLDAGFSVVIATSFGDIFAANAARNGLLPALVDGAALSPMLAAVKDDPTAQLTVDLEACTVRVGDELLAFQIDPARRTMLLNGWDDLDVTAQHDEAIDTFVARDRDTRPWAQTVVERH